ncbi:hypothetical protein D3C86_1134880 [compost metagenome]
MDGRHAAQYRKAHVQRLRGGRGRAQHAHRRVTRIGNLAQGVHGVQTARLRGDVTRRVAAAYPVFQRLVAFFSDDFTTVVGMETVGHDAVETGGAAYFTHGALEQAGGIALAADALDAAVNARGVGNVRAGPGPLLQFDNREAVAVAVANHVERGVVQIKRKGVENGIGLVHPHRQVGGQAGGQRAWQAALAQGQRHPQHGRRVFAGKLQNAIRIERQQRAQRLDSARYMYRFAVAVGERDWRGGLGWRIHCGWGTWDAQ